jgi:hypothetical protein
VSNRRAPINSKDRIVIRSVRRKQPDISKIARAVIGLALEQAAREAAAQQQGPATAPQTRASGKPSHPAKQGSEHDA